jgi:cytochrome c oxidase subunit 3
MDTGIQDKIKVKPYEERVQQRFSTYIMMMFFAIGSISILFLALTLTYLFSKNVDSGLIPLILPPIFYVDTAILAVGSLGLILAQRAFLQDEATAYKIWLYVALLAGISFLIGQVIGWYVLNASGFGIQEHRSGSFLYVISGIHALHIAGGIFFMIYIFLHASKRLKEPALAVVYFSDPIPKARLKLAAYYWHFLGILWLYLLVFFAIVR